MHPWRLAVRRCSAGAATQWRTGPRSWTCHLCLPRTGRAYGPERRPGSGRGSPYEDQQWRPSRLQYSALPTARHSHRRHRPMCHRHMRREPALVPRARRPRDCRAGCCAPAVGVQRAAPDHLRAAGRVVRLMRLDLGVHVVLLGVRGPECRAAYCRCLSLARYGRCSTSEIGR